MVKGCRESLFPVPIGCLSYTLQLIGDVYFPALRPARVSLVRILLGQPPSLHHLRRRLPCLVRRLRRYYGTVRLPMPVHRWFTIIDLSSAAYQIIFSRQSWNLPVLAHEASTRARGLRQRRVTCALAFTRTSVWPSEQLNGVAHIDCICFRGSILRPCVPLSTHHLPPRGSRHMTRGHCGWLVGLRCETLSFSTSCRFIPAQSVFSVNILAENSQRHCYDLDSTGVYSYGKPRLI
jgi:hypothetical protein